MLYLVVTWMQVDYFGCVGDIRQLRLDERVCGLYGNDEKRTSLHKLSYI